MDEPEILCERHGAAGCITLNRPRALNALTHGMVRAIRGALDAWAAEPEVTRVVLTGAGEKAFCAGGDIRRLYELGKVGAFDEALAFWREEYELNIGIKRYPKPYVSLIDGIVMGGGVGVSLHGAHRVAGGRYAFAMPASPAGAQVKQAWMDAINRVLECRQSPRAALNQAQREAQRAIDDAT